MRAMLSGSVINQLIRNNTDTAKMWLIKSNSDYQLIIGALLVDMQARNYNAKDQTSAAYAMHREKLD